MGESDDEEFLKGLIRSAEEEHEKFDKLEDELKDKLEEVEHFEHNLKVLENQLESLERLVGKRDRLHHEVEKRVGGSSSGDLDEARSYVEKVERIGGRIDRLLPKIVGHMDDLHLDEVDELLHEPQDVKDSLRDASQRAKVIQKRVGDLKTHLEQKSDQLRDLKQRLGRAPQPA